MGRQCRALIVDDERLARHQLRSMLAAHTSIEVVGEADGVQKAIAAIRELSPDVVFLDIQMPGEHGFDLLNQLDRPLHVIFVTAYDEYAVRAFEVNALDYLLKPVNPDRLARAIERLSTSRSPEPTESVKRALEYDDHLFLTIGNGSRFLRINTIVHIRAEGVYTEVHTTDGKKALVLKALNEWEERLPEKHFVRIHRSSIVNIEYVERIEKWFNYSYQVHLRGASEPLTMSRRYAAKLKGKLK
jgi:two-component system LytT family response regulator